jgi:hypothetical protein
MKRLSTSNQQSLKKENGLHSPDELLLNADGKSIFLAVPSKLTFQELYQIPTKFSDAMIPEPIALNGMTAAQREESLHEYASHHRDRIQAKFLCRSISQLQMGRKEGNIAVAGGGGNRRSSLSDARGGEEKADHTRPLSTGDHLFSQMYGANTTSEGLKHRRSTSVPSALETLSEDHVFNFAAYDKNSTPPPRPPRGGVYSDTLWQSMILSPNPGFVIKTWKLDHSDAKIFINVFHNEYLDMILENDDYVLPEELQPFIAYGENTVAEDKEGHLVPVYQVMVGSKYFVESYITTEKKITDDDRVRNVRECLWVSVCLF